MTARHIAASAAAAVGFLLLPHLSAGVTHCRRDISSGVVHNEEDDHDACGLLQSATSVKVHHIASDTSAFQAPAFFQEVVPAAPSQRETLNDIAEADANATRALSPAEFTKQMGFSGEGDTSAMRRKVVELLRTDPLRAKTRENNTCNIFTLWDYPKGVPIFYQLNVESWRRHSVCKEPILINNSNIKSWIPDLPDEYFRMYKAAQSDLLRYSLVYHHGGVYMDADVLATRPMSDLTDKIDHYDLISYTSDYQVPKKGQFSSNIMAGYKGSKFAGAVWEAQKKLLTRHCPEADEKIEKVCCFDDGNKQCHIPWTQLGEGVSHNILKKMLKEESPPKIFTYDQDQSFTPDSALRVFREMPKLQDAMAFWKGQEHWDPAARKPLDRMLYHLFNSNTGYEHKTLEELFDSTTVIGHLMNKSFST